MSKRVASATVLFIPLALFGSGLGCELLVHFDRSLDDGGTGDVLVPATLDGYDCPICKDVLADADFDGDETFPEAEPADAPDEASGSEAGAEGSRK